MGSGDLERSEGVWRVSGEHSRPGGERRWPQSLVSEVLICSGLSAHFIPPSHPHPCCLPTNDFLSLHVELKLHVFQPSQSPQARMQITHTLPLLECRPSGRVGRKAGALGTGDHVTVMQPALDLGGLAGFGGGGDEWRRAGWRQAPV